MREIKFRAWDKENNKMIYVDKIVFRTDGEIFRVWDYNMGIEGVQGLLINQDSGIVIQFTGLKDKNGKEIYEGDVIVCRDGKAVIIYEDSFAKFIMDFDYFGKNTLPDFEDVSDNKQDADTCMRSIEVIGNIYENPELLEEKK